MQKLQIMTKNFLFSGVKSQFQIFEDELILGKCVIVVGI